MKIKHSIKKQKIMIKNNFIEIPRLSLKFIDFFNRPYYFYRNEVLFCEEKEVGRYKNIQFLVNSNDHTPPHFHIKTTNPDSEHKVFLNEDFSIKEVKTKFGKPLSQRIKKTIRYWFVEQNGKDEVIAELKRVGVI